MTHNSRNLSLVNTDFVGDFLLAKTGDAELPDASDVVVFQNGSIGAFASRTVFGSRRVGAAFGPHVSIVVGVCPEEQVIGPHASWIVAGVTDQQSCGNGAVSQFPHKAMRSHVSAICFDLPIAANAGSFVGPAASALDDVVPEHLFGCAEFAFVGARLATEPCLASSELEWSGMKLLAAVNTIGGEARFSHPNNLSQVGQASQHKVIA